MNEKRWLALWDVSTYADYAARILVEGTTANGVFGVKTMWEDFERHMERLRHMVANGEQMDLPELVSRVFPNPHYIWITRRDKVCQAVSLVKARQTRIWEWTTDAPHVPQQEPFFDFELIDNVVKENAINENTWRSYFDRWGIRTLDITYEDFVTAYEETATQVIRFLGIDDEIIFASRRMRKLADAQSEEWVKRYWELKHEQQQHG